MANLANINLLKRGKLTSVLGISLDGSRLEGVVLRRTNGSLEVGSTFSVSLSLNPLTAAPELLGREIRNALDQQEVRERTCVVGLPLSWVLTAQVDIPNLSEQDAKNLIALETERAFPCDPATLQIVDVRFPKADGSSTALLAGVPRANVEALSAALRAAKLQPISFTLAISALQSENDDLSKGTLALMIGENSVGLQVTGRSGILSLRALEGALQQEGVQRSLNSGLIAREARITLGQLPTSEREIMRRIRIFGPPDLAQQLCDEMELRFESLGFEVETVTRKSGREFGLQLLKEAPISAALSLAAQKLAGAPVRFEFLPPRVSSWQRISRRYASGRLRMVIIIALAVILLPSLLFGYQQWRLLRLQSQWSQMARKVDDLEKLQEQIRQYRSWYDDSLPCLSILKQLTAIFPTDGTVTAKTIEIRNQETVICSGTARDNRVVLAAHDRLRASGDAADVRLSQIRGRSPTQFTLEYRWSKGESK